MGLHITMQIRLYHHLAVFPVSARLSLRLSASR
nr:MAG TPA: hypothetical protein [Caudoviricetes sp.]